MKCDLMSCVISDGATGRAVTVCRTHNWNFPIGGVIQERCPLGQIEQATEDAIARIRKEASYDQK